MKQRALFPFARPIYLISTLVLGLTGTALAVPPPTFWTGPTTNYSQSAAVLADTLVPGKVALCRGDSGPLFNSATESSSDFSTSPHDTEWSLGHTIDNNNPGAATSFSYTSFDTFRGSAGGNLSAYLQANPTMVLHLINENIYISVTFNSWHQGRHLTNAGGSFASGFSYTRSTPAAVVVPPRLGISSPANGIVFVTPASVPITASVTNGSSPVTNVSFFANGATLLGSITNAPFTITTGSLLAGSYALTAVATAGGITATSAVVNISVIAPPTLGISSPSDGAIFVAPASVPITATVTNGSSPVTNVSFFANGATLLGSTTNAPFTITTASLPSGAYALTAVATAGGVNTTSAIVNISVVALPTLAISSPANGAVFAAPANVQIAASVTNGTSPVTNVAFFANTTTSLGSTNALPFSITAAAALPGLLAEGGEVHLALHTPLVRLFAENFPAAHVWSSTTNVGAAQQPPQPYLQAVGPIDYQAPVGSLGAMRMADGPPAPQAYIRAPAADAAAWAARLDAMAPRKAKQRRAGLVIGARKPRFSDDGMTNGMRKSIPPAELARLAEVQNVHWVALHDRESAAMLADVPGLAFADISPWITDLADTAAVIENLDVVVTVDTGVAHLAGAMGKPVLLMLWRGADWRWGVDRKDSVFYPDVTTFRQTTAGDWRPVLDAVAKALETRG